MGWQWRQRWVSLGLGSAVSGGREKKKNEREKRRMVALVSKWAWEMAWINESGGREKKI